MLHKNAFGSDLTFEELKNYLISHFLLRKLKLYQKFYIIDKVAPDLLAS
jgi:hypothetical protein